MLTTKWPPTLSKGTVTDKAAKVTALHGMSKTIPRASRSLLEASKGISASSVPAPMSKSVPPIPTGKKVLDPQREGGPSQTGKHRSKESGRP